MSRALSAAFISTVLLFSLSSWAAANPLQSVSRRPAKPKPPTENINEIDFSKIGPQSEKPMLLPSSPRGSSGDGIIRAYYVSSDCSGHGQGTPQDPFCKIQYAIDVAQSGDVVILADGNYEGPGNADLVFRGQGITLRSANGPENCIIDGEALPARLLTIDQAEGNTLIQGITFQNGASESGSEWKGGAISLGLTSGYVTAEIADCVFRNNVPPTPGVHGMPKGIGGAVFCRNGDYVIRNCRFEGNEATAGGALFIETAAALVDRCVFQGNVADWSGGAIYSEGLRGSVSLINSFLVGNGLNPSPWQSPCTGVEIRSRDICTIRNNTFLNNNSEIPNSSVLRPHRDQPHPTLLTSNIFWNPGASWEINVSAADHGDVTVNFCNMLGGLERTAGDPKWGAGNINLDPRFVNPAEADIHIGEDSPCFQAGDPDLAPAYGETDIDGQARVIEKRVDMGADEYYSGDCNHNGVADTQDIANGTSQDCNANQTPDECETDCNKNGLEDSCDLFNGTSTDCDGNGVPDECEIAGQDCNANGIPDFCDIASGTSMDCNGNGIPDECDLAGQDCNGNGIPDSCDIANGWSSDCDGDAIPDECEAPVVLYVDDNAPSDPGPGDPDISDPAEDGSREHPFDAIKEAIDHCAVEVIVADGVYTGTGNQEIILPGSRPLYVHAQRKGNNCVIDLQHSSAGAAFYFEGDAFDTQLDGFTIMNCDSFAIQTSGWRDGPQSSTAMIRNCVIKDSRIAIYSQGNSNLQVHNCTLAGFEAPQYGTYGILCWNGYVRVSNCIIAGYDKGLSTEAVSYGGLSGAQVSNCQISGNLDAGIYASGVMDLVVQNCTLTQNTTGLYATSDYQQTNPYVLYNSVVWNNAGGNGYQVCLWYQSLNVSFCDIQDGRDGVVLWGDGTLVWDEASNINADPLFVAPDGPIHGRVNPGLTWINKDFHLKSNSPCINAGDPRGNYFGQTDIDGGRRVVNGRVDMGADEWKSP